MDFKWQNRFTFRLKTCEQTNMKGSVRGRGKGQGVDALFVWTLWLSFSLHSPNSMHLDSGCDSLLIWCLQMPYQLFSLSYIGGSTEQNYSCSFPWTQWVTCSYIYLQKSYSGFWKAVIHTALDMPDWGGGTGIATGEKSAGYTDKSKKFKTENAKTL